jgi:murein DD-endopeptidase MepM/ murein hydrolase activator NlpD
MRIDELLIMVKRNIRLLIAITFIVGLAIGSYLHMRPAFTRGDFPRLLYAAFAAPTSSTPTPYKEDYSLEEMEVGKAINAAINKQSELVLANLLYDIQAEDIRISEDDVYATAWLIMRDLENGEPLPTEPGLAFALQEKGNWRAVLPGDRDWLQTLAAAPVDILTEEAKTEWLLKMAEGTADLPTSPLGGYLLPWAAGKIVNLSQSVSHDRYTISGSAHYAFDFYISKVMWEIHAAKAGTVWMWKDDVLNDDHSGIGNYMVLQDTTTTPVTYQLYLHLAQNSIPAALKTRGVPVMQGQFIGIADNTGQSTGHHLHFQVHTEPLSYWGQSVDITFNDVTINGGRPRRIDAYINELPYCLGTDVCLEGQQSYVSGNIVQGDTTAPDGDITNLTTGQVVNEPSLLIEAWGEDIESGLKTLQIMAQYNGAWHEISPEFAVSPVAYEWDLCEDIVPNGPVSLALRLFDWHGNQIQLAGLKHFIKDYACPAPLPTCEPGPDQISLFSKPNFEGECAVFEAGDYSTTATFPDDQSASLWVGENLWVTLFADLEFRERSETFITNDSNLLDNRIGLNTVSSLIVKDNSTPPSIPLMIWPSAGFSIPASASTSLFWEDTGGAIEFQVHLDGESEVFSEWQVYPYWHMGGLPEGNYTWQVRARNANGESNWSELRSLSISAGELVDEPAFLLPYLYDVEDATASWMGSGLWQRIASETNAFSGQYIWRYGEGEGNDANYNWFRTGDLTSPVIEVPELEIGSIEQPYLRFWSRYDTESQNQHWDQRWVQVSVQDGSFQNLFQLSQDPMNYWVQSPYIDLSAFAGKQIRIRFYFTSLDTLGNNYQGWSIDDVQISMTSLPACSTPGLQTDGLEGAVGLVYGDQVNGEICPPGDEDYYLFRGEAGDTIVVDINAQVIESNLDAVLQLLDSDGTSQLAYHDDELAGVLFDPHLGYRLLRDGDYFLKVMPWDHPGAGGSNYSYDLSIFTDDSPPVAEIQSPISTASLPLKGIVQAITEDEGSGVSHVDFYWHSSDWLDSDWVNIGSDWSGDDGWSMNYSAEEEQEGAAFYIRVFDWAGNWTVAGSWDLVLRLPPHKSFYMPIIVR